MPRYLVIEEHDGEEYVVAETSDVLVARELGGRIIAADADEPVARAWAAGDDSVNERMRRRELLEALRDRIAIGEVAVPEEWLQEDGKEWLQKEADR